jgi:hypothetical protein
MFITYEAFRHPVSFDPQSTMWSAVELGLPTPLFLVTTMAKDDDPPRIFMLRGTGELLEFAKQKPAGRISELHLLQPPRWSECREWALVAMREVLLQQVPPDGSIPSAVVRAANGALYGGFPLALIEGDPGPLSPLASLPA